MNPNENDLDRALRRQVEHLDGAPLTLGDVQSRAKRIQRRRWIAASVSAAAAVAVIAPIGLLLAGNQQDASGPITNPTASTSPTTGSAEPATYRIDLTPPAEGTTGAELGIPYWYAGQLTTPTGLSIPIQDRLIDAAQDPVSGQWAGIVKDDQANLAWTSYDDTGTVLQSAPSLGERVAVTPDGSRYAYLADTAPDGSAPASWQLVRGGADPQTWDLGGAAPARPGQGPVGILSDGTVVYEFAAGKVMLARSDGSTELVPGSYLRAVDASTATDRIAVQTSYNNDNGTSCWAVVDASGQPDAKTCDYALDGFSADGRYVAGYPSGTDGLGPGSVSILDASTLEPVATFTMPSNGFLATPLAWSGDTVVTNAWHDGTWYVELLGIDGALQLRSVGGQGDEFSPPFHLGAGPLDVAGP